MRTSRSNPIWCLFAPCIRDQIYRYFVTQSPFNNQFSGKAAAVNCSQKHWSHNPCTGKIASLLSSKRPQHGRLLTDDPLQSRLVYFKHGQLLHQSTAALPVHWSCDQSLVVLGLQWIGLLQHMQSSFATASYHHSLTSTLQGSSHDVP